MITISGAQASVDTTGWSPLAASIYERKQSSSEIYPYPSVQQLRFEMEMRNAIVAAAEERGLILLSCGVRANVIRILVPLTIGDDTLEEGLRVLEASIESVFSSTSI